MVIHRIEQTVFISSEKMPWRLKDLFSPSFEEFEISLKSAKQTVQSLINEWMDVLTQLESLGPDTKIILLDDEWKEI